MDERNWEFATTISVSEVLGGMRYAPVPPALAEVFEFDPDVEAAFQRLLPGRQRNHLHQIGQAKSDDTVAKRIAALLREIGH